MSSRTLQRSQRASVENLTTEHELKIEKERIDIDTRKRFSSQLPNAFFFSLVFTFGMIFFKGLGLIAISDTVIISLLGYTVAYIPVMLVIMLKQLYSVK